LRRFAAPSAKRALRKQRIVRSTARPTERPTPHRAVHADAVAISSRNAPILRNFSSR
jgi:hypothetical protein